MKRIGTLVVLLFTIFVLCDCAAIAQDIDAPMLETGTTAVDSASIKPASEFWRIIFLQDYNTRIVVLSVAFLGAASGLVGSFTLLRKRALIGDALSHASLPGITIAYMAAPTLGLNSKSLTVLLTGATISGLIGVLAILWIRSTTKLKEDAALGIVLTVFFGCGAAFLGIIQNMNHTQPAGLEDFIFGKTSAIGVWDTKLIIGASLISTTICILLFKELKLLCFDSDFARSRGSPILLLDIALMSLVVLVTMVGLQAVGLMLMVALLIIPAAASRFWTDRLALMAVVSTILGALGGVIGAMVSTIFQNLPSGAMIVLTCSSFFLISLLFGTQRGLLPRYLRRKRVNWRVARQHLLRSMFELIEQQKEQASISANDLNRKAIVSLDSLMLQRTWSRRELLRTLSSASQDDLIRQRESGVQFTQAGYTEAARLTRQHRLWELYLITHADVASANVDRDADHIEHVLEPEIVDQLEDLLDEQDFSLPVPANPH